MYVEKPGSHNISEGRKIVQAARKYDRVVQHGPQCRSSTNVNEGIKHLHDGVVGRYELHARKGSQQQRRNAGRPVDFTAVKRRADDRVRGP